MRSRPLSPAERAVAALVFGPAPWFDDVRLTDLRGLRRRAFTVPGVGRRMYCSIGSHYAETLDAGVGRYCAPGQLLIHELVHAWQIVDARSVLGFLARAAWLQARHELGRRPGPYSYDAYAVPAAAGRATGDRRRRWDAFTIEQQATIVDEWFGGQSSPTGRRMDPDGPYADLVEMVRFGPGRQ